MSKLVKNIMDKMSIEQKVGSLFTFGFCGNIISPIVKEAILKYHCGGFRITPSMKNFGSYVSPDTGEALVVIEQGVGYKSQRGIYMTTNEYKKIIEELQSIARQRELDIPLHISFDSEGGGGELCTIAKYIRWQSQMGIRAADNPEYAYKIALLAGRQMKAMGLTSVHSPVLDVNVCPENPGCGVRAFSDRAEDVAIYGEQMAKGYIDAGIIPAGKHFPNLGDNKEDSHYGLITVTTDRETMMKRDLLPYRELIKKDLLPAIMPAHNIYEAFDSEDVATVSKKILTDLLRDELGFKGVITTDSITMAGVAVKYGIEDACTLALSAGADLILMKGDNHLNGDCFNRVLQAIDSGKLSEKEIDEKVERVLSMKEKFGMFTEKTTDENPDEMYYNKEVIELNEELARKTTLIAKDTNGILPIKPEDKILLIEQERRTTEDTDSHSAMLYKKCLEQSTNIEFLEVAFSYDDEDIERIRNKVAEYDLIVMTNFYSRGTAQNCDVVNEILSDKSKKLVLITNTPYPTSIPKSADCIVVSFGQETSNLEFIAKMLYGKEKCEGVWPIEYQLQS